MNESTINQFYSFLIFIGIGILIVLIFDVFRIFRKAFKTSDIITFIEDIIFGILASFILFFSILKFNSGELRIYVFLGIFLGAIIYLLTVSKFFIKINVIIINTFKKIIKIIIYPFKLFIKTFLNPISFFFVNFHKFFTNIFEKNKFITRKNRVKKGF